MSVRVLIVGDVALHRTGIACLLGPYEHGEVVGPLASDAITREPPEHVAADVVLIDLPPAEAYAAAPPLSAAYPQARLIALAVQETEDAVVRCAEAGISGYSTREGCVEELVGVIDGVGRGELACPPRIAGRLMQHVGALAGSPHKARVQRLTAREREIVEMISEGFANKEIARRLCLELPTVKPHVHNILDKLQVRNRTEAANAVRTDTINGSSSPSPTFAYPRDDGTPGDCGPQSLRCGWQP
jgi:DNA-binding NarL/FixJ family response regulator